MSQHLINRVSILGAGLIGGSFALALRKYTEDLHITAWDKPEAAARGQGIWVRRMKFSLAS